jgi:hypothetical protein
VHGLTRPREGVRAQVQHLKAYASTEPLKQECVDPRFKLVTRGVAPSWEDLNGRWAVPGNGYGESIVDIHRRILETQVAEPEEPQQNDFEGFERIVRLLLEKLFGWLKRLLKGEYTNVIRNARNVAIALVGWVCRRKVYF